MRSSPSIRRSSSTEMRMGQTKLAAPHASLVTPLLGLRVRYASGSEINATCNDWWTSN